MAENFSKSDKNYGLPKVELIPINRDQPGVAKPPVIAETRKEQKESRIVPILLLVAFGLIVASAVFYFFFWDSGSDQDYISENDPEATVEDRVTLDDSESVQPETSDIEESSSVESTPEILEDQPGTIQAISERTERYYIFLGSYKFKAYARRHADKLAADGFAVKLITPDNWVGMRVAVGNYGSVAEASADVSRIEEKYGNQVVVSKY